MRIRLIILIALLLSKAGYAQGYLGYKQYVSMEILHPACGIKDFQVSYGLLFNRFYAIDMQLSYTPVNMDLYSRFIYIKNNALALDEYHMGKVRVDGIGAKLGFRTFKKASYKAAPIGWYMNYAIKYIYGALHNEVVSKSGEGFDPVTGSFIVNSSPFKLQRGISIYSFLVTPGKTMRLFGAYFLDLGLDIGLRVYGMDDKQWTLGSQKIYNIEPLFKNNINRWYQYKEEHESLSNLKSEFIYEPFLKVGYLF
jgi:hypothetical protein